MINRCTKYMQRDKSDDENSDFVCNNTNIILILAFNTQWGEFP